MPIFVQTRGRNADYRFLGGAPKEKWWLGFRDYTSFEEPTIIISSDAHGWRVYLGGIPSSRRDRVGTPIRYTLVANGIHEGMRNGYLGLISAFLEDISSSSTDGRVQLFLDDLFPEKVVEDLLRDKSESAQEEIARLLEKLEKGIESFERSDLSGAQEPKSWAGSLESGKAREHFLNCVAMVLADKQNGFAALLNLVGKPQDLQTLGEQYPMAAILLGQADPSIGFDIIPLRKGSDLQKKKLSAKVRPVLSASTWIVILGIVAIMGVLGAILQLNQSEKSQQRDPVPNGPIQEEISP